MTIIQGTKLSDLTPATWADLLPTDEAIFAREDLTNFRVPKSEFGGGTDLEAYLGALEPSGYNSAPTFIDPAAADWADVVANGRSWVQFDYNAANKTAVVTVGNGNSDSYTTFFTYPDAAGFYMQGTGGGSFSYLEDGTDSQAVIVGDTGQTAPLLDLQDSASVSILSIAPDGKVGGVAPSSGWSIKWNGTKWVAAA